MLYRTCQNPEGDKKHWDSSHQRWHISRKLIRPKRTEANNLLAQMNTLKWKRRTPPVRYSGKRDVVWIEPTLIAEIEYRGWTGEVKPRHSSYKGLRELQDKASRRMCLRDCHRRWSGSGLRLANCSLLGHKCFPSLFSAKRSSRCAGAGCG